MAYESPYIHVYNAEPFAFNRTITVDGMKMPVDIVASENVLYVSEWLDKLIHRIQLPEKSVSSWTVDGTRLTLSIAKNGNVIVAGRHPNKIFEYTSFGNLVREIVVNKLRCRPDWTNTCDTIGRRQVPCMSLYVNSPSRCMIDNTGRVIKCYEGEKGTSIGQLNLPFYLAIDSKWIHLSCGLY